jgi:hypothetical protein
VGRGVRGGCLGTQSHTETVTRLESLPRTFFLSAKSQILGKKSNSGSG